MFSTTLKQYYKNRENRAVEACGCARKEWREAYKTDTTNARIAPGVSPERKGKVNSLWRRIIF